MGAPIKPYLDGLRWNNRPAWDYIGTYPRTRGTAHPPFNTLMCTPQLQAWAIDHGFFIGRCMEHERVVLYGLPDWKPSRKSPAVTREPWFIVDYNKPKASMCTIEHCVFLDVPGFNHLLRFIQQQDQYGWLYRWDTVSQNYHGPYVWYAALKALARPVHKRSPHNKDLLSSALVQRLVASMQNNIVFEAGRYDRLAAGRLRSKASLIAHNERERKLKDARALIAEDAEAKRIKALRPYIEKRAQIIRRNEALLARVERLIAAGQLKLAQRVIAHRKRVPDPILQ